MAVQVLVLGPIEVRVGGRRIPVTPLERALIALLALSPARTVSTAAIVDALWGERPPQYARTRVQNIICVIRRKLAGAADALSTRAPGYCLAAQIDHVSFDRLLSAGRGWAAQRRSERACEMFGEAMSLWRGPALDGVDAPFATAARATLSEAQLLAMEDYADAQLASARHQRLTPSLVDFVARHPYRERARGQLMVALYRSGRQSEAVAAYRAGRALLNRELGLEPSRELQELYRSILLQEPCAGLPPAFVR